MFAGITVRALTGFDVRHFVELPLVFVANKSVSVRQKTSSLSRVQLIGCIGELFA